MHRGNLRKLQNPGLPIALIFIMLVASLLLLPTAAYSSPLSILTGDSNKTKMENERKASQMLEELLNDGTLTESESNSAFLTLVGAISDNVLTSIYESLSPSIAGLISRSGSRGFAADFLDKNLSFLPIGSNSFLGRLLAVLLCIECLILGIKSFLSGNGGVFQRAVSKLIVFVFTLAFLSVMPLIGRAVINLFASMGNAVSSAYRRADPTSSKIFEYMPSDVLDSLAFCKNILSIEKVRIGGYTLPTLIPHLTVNIGELIISLPFLYIMMMIIFWYAEMFVILLSAYIVIPVCTLSELNISSIRKIMRSLVLQGMKLFAGIFIANMATNIVLKSVEKLEGSITSTSNTVIFCIFMTLVIFFLILKAPNAMINAVNGETEKTGSSLISGAIGGGIAALGAALPTILGNKKNDGKRMPQPYSPTGGMPTPSGNASNPNASGKAGKASSGADAKQHSAQNKNVPETSERIANDNAKQSNGARYGEVTVRATPGRMEAAKTELMNEGVENITESMIKDRAIRDAKIEKLVKMEKNGFMTQNNEFNKPAFEQLQRLRDGRE